MTRKADIITNDHGSIWSFHGATKRGQAWLDANIPNDGNCSRPAGAVFCEHGYGMDIAIGALTDGLRLQDAATGRFARLP